MVYTLVVGSKNRTHLFWRNIYEPLFMQVAAEETSKTVTITCPEGYEMVGTDCYFISMDTHTGSSAHHYCKKNGGHAAVIESQEEMDLLKGERTHICTDCKLRGGEGPTEI